MNKFYSIRFVKLISEKRIVARSTYPPSPLFFSRWQVSIHNETVLLVVPHHTNEFPAKQRQHVEQFRR